MNVGIYLGDEITQKAGGAFSLLGTIKKEVQEHNGNAYTFFVVYHGSENEPYKTEKDGLSFINLLAIEDKPLTHTAGGNVCVPRYRTKINIAAARENIEVFYFAYPCRFDNLEYPYIYTLWDLGHRTVSAFPEVSTCNEYDWESREKVYQTMLYKAVFVLTGNETGKCEILQNYCIPPNKIRIAPFPVASFCQEAEEKPPFALPNDGGYFFYPAQFWPHKNHTAILDALVLLREKHGLHPHVYFTGSDHGNMEYVKSEVMRLSLQDQVHFAGFVSNGVLKYFYTHAKAMIFASLMGPNNMPPIEAVSLFCPVIITNIAGHKEQMQDAAMYFDGYQPETLSEAMCTMLTNKAARDEIIEKERHLAAKFNSVNYFGYVLKLIDEFSLMRRTWNNDYAERATQFSVIIPVHNSEKTLRECIQSVLDQTYPHFELILVDDNSTDSSLDILHEYAAKDKRIVIIEQEEGKHGAQAARNAGIRAARYEWLMFNESGDRYLAHKIQREAEELRAEGHDYRCVIYSDGKKIDAYTKEQSYLALPHISIENSFKDLIKTSGPMFQSLVCSAKLMRQARLLDENVDVYQDWDTSLTLAQYGYFVHIKEALFVCYAGKGDLTPHGQQCRESEWKYIEQKYQKGFLSVYGNNKKKSIKGITKSIVCFLFKTTRKVYRTIRKALGQNTMGE